MNSPYNYPPQLPATSFTFSILVSSPIRSGLSFCPVNAMLLPLASTEVHFASIIIIGLDLLMSFLYKKSLVQAPSYPSPDANYPAPLNFNQLNQLILSASQGQLSTPSPVSDAPPTQESGPVGLDEPLFPDNLNVSLLVSTRFTPLNGSPDTSFSVPLFEVPGTPGNLLISLALLIAQFFVERTGIGPPSEPENGGKANDNVQATTNS